MPKPTIANLSTELANLKAAVSGLIEEYGTDWCSDGLEAVSEALSPFGVKFPGKEGTLSISNIGVENFPASAITGCWGSTTEEFDSALGNALVGLGPVKFVFAGAEIVLSFGDIECNEWQAS